MKNQNWFKKHEKAVAAGLCAAVLGTAGLTGAGLSMVQAKSYNWEVSEDLASSKDRQDKEHVRVIQERIRKLEKHGVTYDEDTDTIYYDGQKVRWLIDEYGDISYNLYNKDGCIDVYTVRDHKGQLEGVRIASQEEYDKKEVPAYTVSEAGAWSAEGITFCFTESADAAESMNDAEICMEGAAAVGEVEEDMGGYCDDYATEIMAEAMELPSDAVYKGDEDLYESLGLVWNKKGYWTYGNQAVEAVWMEDGSFTTWGDVQEKAGVDEGVYLYIEKEAEKGQASFRVRELDFDEFSRLYTEKHPGSHISK